jgi:pimeloyl-ACP methyl ester carboxylesterase
MAAQVVAEEKPGPAGAPVAVLVHGAVDTGGSFAEVVRRLPELRTVSYDRRGYGSAWPLFRSGLTLADHVDDLLDIIGGRQVTVVGHSLGGLVALGAALRRPDLVRSVGVYETAMPWADWWTQDARDSMLAEIDVNAARALGRTAIDPKVRAGRQTEWAACRNEVTGIFEEPFRWQDLTTGLTVGVGTASDRASARDARLLAARLSAPLIELPAASHLAHRTHPELFARLVRSAVTQANHQPR